MTDRRQSKFGIFLYFFGFAINVYLAWLHAWTPADVLWTFWLGSIFICLMYWWTCLSRFFITSTKISEKAKTSEAFRNTFLYLLFLFVIHALNRWIYLEIYPIPFNGDDTSALAFLQQFSLGAFCIALEQAYILETMKRPFEDRVMYKYFKAKAYMAVFKIHMLLLLFPLFLFSVAVKNIENAKINFAVVLILLIYFYFFPDPMNRISRLYEAKLQKTEARETILKL